MIRKAAMADADLIEEAYNEHFQYEQDHTAFTVFKKGVYPTKADAEKAIKAGAMYVYEESESIAGSMILDKTQPEEYSDIVWKSDFSEDQVMVIHLLMVRPGMSNRGIASSLIRFAIAIARNNHSKALRLDTGSQNIPAVSLYQKHGFEIIAKAPKKVGNVIAHKNHLYLEKKL